MKEEKRRQLVAGEGGRKRRYCNIGQCLYYAVKTVVSGSDDGNVKSESVPVWEWSIPPSPFLSSLILAHLAQSEKTDHSL